MQINFKDKLRALRREKNITQALLADYLGITPQSVGKWERGEGYPDITLLPRIAFYFDVTVDELLCVDGTRVEEAIGEYIKRSDACRKNGEADKRVAVWEQAYAEFPNDCRVIEGLMLALDAKEIYPCPKVDAERIITLGETLLQRTTDAEQRKNALMCLCRTYDCIDKEKALKYADMCGSFYGTREELRAGILDGEDGVRACQSYIQSLVQMAALIAFGMTSKNALNNEEKIDALRFAVDIIMRLYDDGNVGFYAFDLSNYCSALASEYAASGDYDAALAALQNSCKYAVADANPRYTAYTASNVNRLKYNPPDVSKNFSGNACDLRLRELESVEFDPIRNDEIFLNAVSELKKNSGA